MESGIVFNVGARRSGTYWLQRIVCAHPSVAEVPSETHLFSHGIAPFLERFQHGERDDREVGKVYADRALLIEHMRALCDAVLGQFASGDTTRISERTPLHVHHLPLIREIYPEARFVHIVRDGRDVARSLVAQPWGPETVAEAAGEWRSSVEAGLAAADAAVLEVRYEELLASPREGIERIYRHLELERGLDQALAAASDTANVGPHDGQVGAAKWREAWGRRELRDFERVAGELLRRLGYDQ